METEVKILFVCTGNTCRSPMAEYYFRDYFMRENDLNFPELSFSSCGTMAYAAGPASEGTINVLKEINVDVSEHRSQVINEELVNQADIILTMSYMHYQTVKNFLRNDHYVELHMLSDLVDGQMGVDVPDPIGGTVERYRSVFSFIRNIEEPLKELIIKVAKRKQELL